MFTVLRQTLALTGRHAPLAYALSIVLGLMLPQIASALRPIIPITIFMFIVLAFARANLPGLKAVFARPTKLATGVLLSVVLPPAIAFVVLSLPPLASADPGIRLAIAIMASAPILNGAPVFIGVIGLENSFALTIMVLGMVATPFTAPFFASILAGANVPISPYALAERLAIFIGGGMIAGLAVRRMFGLQRIAAVKNELDGCGVLLYFLFAIAAMDGVIAMALAHPIYIVAIIVTSALFALTGFAISYAITPGFEFNDRFSLAICTGLRNMGLVIAPIFSVVPDTTFLYFALAQFPVYGAPVALKALKARMEPKLLEPKATPKNEV